ncbi:MAG: FliM/FliN family flagellar motor switch protein [Armatimonadetes bacterium]|nr:FliM/FliN family flagellar motor switch protein [Armatimonadota bacterium]
MAVDRSDEQQDRGQPSAESLAPLLSGVCVPVRVLVGRASVAIANLLRLRPGDVLELDCSVHDPVDVLVGDQAVARGELVSIDGRLGVRVIEILPPQEGDGA